MVNFIPGQHRERAALFDSHISTTLDTLRNPEVRRALGWPAIFLTSEIEHAFLPNVRHGIILLPSDQEGTSNVAYLPLTRSDGNRNGFRISRGLAAPGLLRAERVGEATGVNVLEQYKNDFPGRNYQIETDIENAVTHSGSFVVEGRGTRHVVKGRSTILSRNCKRSDEELSETLAHEFMHAEDNKSEDLDPVISEEPSERARHAAFMELRGYQVSHRVLDGLGYYDDLKVAMNAIWEAHNLTMASTHIPDSAVEQVQATLKS